MAESMKKRSLYIYEIYQNTQGSYQAEKTGAREREIREERETMREKWKVGGMKKD